MRCFILFDKLICLIYNLYVSFKGEGMKRWLTEELDRKPYKCDLDKLKKIFDEIADAKTKVERYFEVHPKAKKAIVTDEKRKKRFRDSALSYLALESGDEKTPCSGKKIMEIRKFPRPCKKNRPGELEF